MQDRRAEYPGLEWIGRAVAVKLTPINEFSELSRKIHSGEIPSEDAALADAFVLGYASPAKTDDGSLDYIVLSDYEADEFDEETDDFAQLFSKTAEIETRTPVETSDSKNKYAEILWFMWGWVWKWQMRGKEDEKIPGAVIITGKQVRTSEAANYKAGYVFRQTKITFTFDEDNRPTMVYDVGDWYHTLINTSTNPVFYLENKEDIEASDAVESSTDPNTLASPLLIAGQDLEESNVVYSWYDSEGDLNHITERRKSVTVSETITSTVLTGIAPCTAQTWTRIETEIVLKFYGIYLTKDGDAGTDVEYTSILHEYTEEYYGLGWNERIAEYNGNGSMLYVSSSPGVFWLVQEQGPATGWTFDQTCPGLDPPTETHTESSPPMNRLVGIWNRTGTDGSLPLYDTIPGHPSGCLNDCNTADFEYERVSVSKNTLCTGKELITTLDIDQSDVLSNLFDAIGDNFPDPVPDLLLYSRPAYNINGYLYADIPLSGLCTECIETRQSVWIGGA
jgi:hypothetical protein